ncbi:unnamed protein product [Phytophthora fragariaefolia]|uniref:Unnamed protein product n=1 Tax=Phytophthora fragariaefolia TaxID=1490495 RepID=A0A9W6XN80_9STRA|nr:unnamed protein product [Phytophthora fragariaefolia]
MDEQALQHGDSLQQMFASLAAMVHEQQQQFMAQTAELQHKMVATLQQQQQAPAPQQPQHQSSEAQALATREYPAEGITMPKFSGTKEDDVGGYMFSAKLYFESKNINEFTAPDRQELLRDQLLRLRQKNFSCLEDYAAAFRAIIGKVEDMSDIDKVMHFQKVMLTEGKQEVKLRQFRTTTEAISFALMYDRTHGVSSRHHGRPGLQSVQRRSYRSYPQPRQRMEEQPTPMEIGNARFVSREECMRRNLCFYCKEPSHRLVECHKRQARNNARGSSRPPQGCTSFRANQSSFRRVVDYEDGSDDDEDDFVEDSDAHVEVLDSLQLNMVSVNGEVCPNVSLTAERFDGTTTPARMAQRCCETLSFDGRSFKDVSLIEWEVSENQDVILSHPWLVQFNPIINWQTGVMRFPIPRLMQDLRSLNDSLEVAAPTVASTEVTSDFLQHPLPANLGQPSRHVTHAHRHHSKMSPSLDLMETGTRIAGVLEFDRARKARSNGVEPSGEMPSDLLIGPDGQDSHLPRLSDRYSEGSVGPNTKRAEYSE